MTLNSLKIATGLALVFPGILLVPGYVGNAFIQHGGQLGSPLHYVFVLGTLVAVPLLGLKLLNS